jgi:hypothetical protein
VLSPDPGHVTARPQDVLSYLTSASPNKRQPHIRCSVNTFYIVLNVNVTWQMKIFNSYSFIILSDKYLLSLYVGRLVVLPEPIQAAANMHGEIDGSN